MKDLMDQMTEIQWQAFIFDLFFDHFHTRYDTLNDPSALLLTATQWKGETSQQLKKQRAKTDQLQWLHKFHNRYTMHCNACHVPTIFLPISSSSSRCLILSFIAALNQRRQVYSQWPVVTVIASHTWRAIVMTKSSCILGLDILLITFQLELLDP